MAFFLSIFLTAAALGGYQEPISALSYRAPNECPDGRNIKRRVYELVRRDTLPSYDAVSADIEITQIGEEQWQLVLRTSQAGHPGERQLRADKCETLANSVVLMIALMINPKLNLDEKVEAGVSDEAGTNPEKIDDEQTDRRVPDWVFAPHLLVGGVLDLGTIAAVSGGAVLGLGLQINDFSVDMGSIFLLPRENSVTDAGPPGGKMWLVGGELTGVWVYTLNKFRVGPYLQLEIAGVNARGVGVDYVVEKWMLHVGLGGGLETHWSLGKDLRLKCLLGLLVPTMRRRYLLDNIGEMHTVWPVVARFSLQLEWRFEKKINGSL